MDQTCHNINERSLKIISTIPLSFIFYFFLNLKYVTSIFTFLSVFLLIYNAFIYVTIYIYVRFILLYFMHLSSI